MSRAIVSVGLWALLAVQLVVLAGLWAVRVDLTADGRHTLAPTTRALLAEAEAPVEVRAFLPAQIQPPYRAAVAAVDDVLDALRAAGARVVVRDPTEDARWDAEAEGYGIEAVSVQAIEGDRPVRRRVRFGAAVLYRERQVVMGPVAQPADAEYAVARALYTAIRGTGRPVIGIAQGHGEPDIMQSPLAQLLSPLGEVRSVPVDGRALPAGLDVLLVVAPTKPFDARARYTIDQHLMRGGALVALLDYRPVSEVFPDVLVPVTTGLEPLLARYGLVVDTARTVVDRVRARPAPIGRDASGRLITVQHPLYPSIRDLASDHPVTRGLRSLATPMAAPIALKPPAGVEAVALARSGPDSVLRTEVRALDPAGYRAPPSDGKAVEAPGPGVVVAAVEGVLPSAFAGEPRPPAPASANPFAGDARPEPPFVAAGQREARVLVATSGGRMLAAQENALLLLQNAVEWAVTAGELAALRARAAEDPPLDDTTPAARAAVKYTALLLPTLGLFAFGAARRWRRRRRA